MKNLRSQLLVILLMTSISQLTAQHIKVHSNEFLSKISDIHRISDDEFIMASKTLGLDFWTYGRIDWVKNGKVVREIELPFFCKDIQLHEINGKIEVDIDYYGECDTQGGFIYSFRLDTVKNDYVYPESDQWILPSNSFYQMKRYEDSLYVAVLRGDESEDPDTLGFYNLERKKLNGAVLPGIDFKNLEIFEDEVVIYNQNSLSILTGTSANITYSTISSNEEILNVKLDSSLLYVLTGTKISVINYAGELLDSISIDIEEFTPSDLEYFHGTSIDKGLYIIGTHLDGGDGFFHYNQEKWIDLSSELNPSVKVHDLINFENELLWVTGNVITSDARGEFRLQNMTYQEIGETAKDDLISIDLLGVNRFSEHSVEFVYTLNNLQDKPVKDINLFSSNVHSSGYCPGYHYENNVSLEALESRTIRDTVNKERASNLINDFCIFTSGPDRQLDGDLSNNFACRSEISNTSEQETHEISVYPNPAYNFINLDPKYNGSSYEISSVNGQAVLKGRFFDQIMLERLNSGIYFLSIISDNEIIVSKFVKSE